MRLVKVDQVDRSSQGCGEVVDQLNAGIDCEWWCGVALTARSRSLSGHSRPAAREPNRMAMLTEGWRSKTETMAARILASGSSWRSVLVPKALTVVQVSRNPQRCKGRPTE